MQLLGKGWKTTVKNHLSIVRQHYEAEICRVFFSKTGAQSLLSGTVVLYRQRMCIWEINGTLLNIILNLTQKQPWTCKPSRRWARSKKATRAAASVERPASPPAPRTLPPEQPSIPLDLFYS